MSEIPSYRTERDRLQAEFARQAPAEALKAYADAAAQVATLDFESRAPRLGQYAPDFELTNQRGEAVALSEIRQDGPVVVVFYRGEWCPYCNLQLRAFQGALEQITSLGGRLVAVSLQRPDDSLSMAEKNDLAFDVLSDAAGEAVAAYGLGWEVGEPLRGMLLANGTDLASSNATGRWVLPAAATFVITRDGMVVFSEINGDWTKRTEPLDVIEVLEELA